MPQSTRILFACPLEARRLCIGSLLLAAWLVATPTLAAGPTPQVTQQRNPTVGAPGLVDDVILPGSELTGRPIRDGDAMVVRVLKATPHGDAFRYRIQFQGLEPGDYDLSQWLVRKDGSPAENLPAVEVSIASLLPEGQITPNELEAGWIPRLGGYRRVAIGVAIVWVAGLLALIFVGRRRKKRAELTVAPVTLAELLEERLRQVFDGHVDRNQYAELERMLVAMWRRKLQLEDVGPESALQKIKAHPDAGPLMRQLEAWLHQPAPPSDTDLARLLEPYRSMSPDELMASGDVLTDAQGRSAE